jgi:PAS domain S-box-containing protein
MRFFHLKDLPIQRKMLVLTMLICGAVLAVASAALFAFQIYTLRANFRQDIATLARIIADNSTAAVSFDDPKAAQEILGSLQAKPFFSRAFIVRSNGVVFAEFPAGGGSNNPSEFPAPGRFGYASGQLLYSQPIQDVNDKPLGVLYLGAQYSTVFQRMLCFYALVILAVAGISIGLAALLSGRLQAVITDPVLALAHTAQLIAERQDYSLRAPGDRRGDELGHLASVFNQMLSRIQSQDAALSLSQQRMEALVHSIDGIVWECDAPSLQFTFVSRQVERLLGYKPEDWLGSAEFWQSKIHPEDAATAIATCHQHVKQHRPYSYEYRMIAADGHTVWIRESAVVLSENNGPAKVRGIFLDITEQKLAAEKLDKLNRQLVETSRHAGMAEVATGVLHNVGNVLNSVNVSTTIIREKLRGSEVASLVKLAALLQEHAADSDAFLTADPKGKLVPRFIIQLAEHLAGEHDLLQQEHEQLARNIEHIKEIVAMQQNYARVSGVLELVSLANLVDDALRINMAGFSRHGVKVIRQYAEVPPAMTDQHKILQILVNLVHNAKYALDEAGDREKRLTVSIGMNGNERLQVTVSDNGVGIPPENLTRIFSHGFSTRKGGHGFGLHSGANAAKEMGGSLTAQSDGLGKGSSFTLELPIAIATHARSGSFGLAGN